MKGPQLFGRDDRGQGHVLEGIAAALLILTSVIFALQVTAVTPLTASTANQHLQTQAAGATSGLLAAAEKRGTLREAVLYWNESASQFHKTSRDGQYADRIPEELQFGTTLESSLSSRGLIYNVNLLYANTEGNQRERRLLHQGEPTDHAVSVTRTVTIYDDDRLLNEDGTISETTVGEVPGFFAPNVSEGPLYNVVQVEVVVWRV